MKPLNYWPPQWLRLIKIQICILIVVTLVIMACRGTSTITKQSNVTREVRPTREVGVTPAAEVTPVVEVTKTAEATPTLIPTSSDISKVSTFYVDATRGDDSNPGTIGAPWRTIEKINSTVFMPGDSILFKRGEVWKAGLYFTSSGTSNNNIIIGAYGTGNLPVIDGNNYTIPGTTGVPLVTIAGNYVYLSDIEIRYASDVGLTLEGQHDTAHGIYAHHNYHGGIRVDGDYGIVEYSTAYYNSVWNEFGVEPSHDSTGITAARNPNYAILRHNTVYMTWGIGISTYEANGAILEDNISYDNWGPNAYISNATNVLFQRNFVYSTGAMNPYNSEQIGIQIGDEIASPVLSDITIINNIVYHTNRNLYCLRGYNHSYTNVLIANNTFVNSTAESGVKIRSGITWKNVLFVDNIIQQDGPLPVISVENNAPGLNFNHNLWSKRPQAVALGVGDIIGYPLLFMTGSPYYAGFFKPAGLSPALNAGAPLAEVVDDYDGTARDANPNLGAFETYIP
jgi:hypothetical protein